MLIEEFKVILDNGIVKRVESINMYMVCFRVNKGNKMFVYGLNFCICKGEVENIVGLCICRLKDIFDFCIKDMCFFCIWIC